jgi:hypothetical protein
VCTVYDLLSPQAIFTQKYLNVLMDLKYLFTFQVPRTGKDQKKKK